VVTAAAAVELCLRRRRHSTTDSNHVTEALRLYSELRVDRCEEMFRRSAERVEKQRKGENTTQDVQQWIANWEPPAQFWTEE